MSFIEIQFSTDISYGANGSPIYSTDVVTMFSEHASSTIVIGRMLGANIEHSVWY